MKILFLEQFSELGGGQQCLLDLLPAVREQGWIAVVAAPGSGALLDRAAAAGARVETIKLGPYSNGSKSVADAARFAWDTASLSRWIARQDADLIYAGGPRTLAATALGARGRPVIFHAHSLLARGYERALAGWAIRRTRATVIANSRHVCAPLERHVKPERVHLVYNGVDEIPFAQRDGVRRIGVVARIAPEKGQTDFLKAVAVVSKSLPEVRFVICGAPLFSDPGYLDEVRRLAVDLPVEFSGWRDDIGDVLAKLDLLVVPSTSAEATTRVILEAFSSGVPVIAYSSGGIPEIVRDSENGFLVPECEPQALARRILDAAKLNRESVAAGARADWERNYTVARYREQVIEVIAGHVSTSRSPRAVSARAIASDVTLGNR